MSNAHLAKDTVSGVAAMLAMLGITPQDFPLFAAIAFGLVGGTLAAWARETQNGKPTGWRWLAVQMAAWLMLAVVILALNDYPGLTPRWSGALAALGAFASREGLIALHKRTVREIEERKL